MKCKVKKIPKYAEGTPFYKNADFYSQAGNFITQQIDNVQQSKQGVTAGGVVKGMAGGAATGAAIGSIVPGIGTAVGAIVGGAIGGITSGWGSDAKVNYDTNSINYSDIYTGKSGIAGLWHSDEDEKRAARNVQNANVSKIASGHVYNEYYNQPNIPVQPMVNAAEGGVIPNDEILVGVTAGEVYKNANTGEWGIVKGKGMNSKKPKQDDAERMLIPEGSTIINKHKDYVYSEWGNRTGADIMKPLVKPIKTTGKYAEGTKAAVDAVGKKVLRKQELRKQELHQGQIKNKYSKGGITNYDDIVNQKYEEVDDTLNVLIPHLKINPRRSKLEEELFKPQTPEITGKDRRRVYHLAKAGETMSDYLPMASALLKNYDYQRVQPRIGRNNNIPVDYNINDVLVDNQQAHAINNYNISQMGGSTGAYLAAAGQSASNLAKANSKARIYQKNKQNELIARNIAQLNDWERYANNQLWAADVATAQNQGMAQQMRDQVTKDAYEFQTGRRNDRWKLSMLEPMFKYAVDDNIWKKFVI